LKTLSFQGFLLSVVTRFSGDAPPMAVCLPIFNRFYTLSGNITPNSIIT